MQPGTACTFDSAAAWAGRDMSTTDEWTYQLNAAEVADALRVADVVRSAGTSATALAGDAIPLGSLAGAAKQWREALHHGRGFVLVRGLPVERMTQGAAAALYWLLGQQLGSPVPQNFMGELLTDIRDTGADADDPSTRLYKTKADRTSTPTEPTSSAFSV